MDFSTLMETLFTLDERFPDMTWSVADFIKGPVVTLTLPISHEHADLLRQAQDMFS
jgi:hypothetical protein